MGAWWALLGVATGVRLVVAGVLPLSADEAYYWVWSRALAPGYVDHPPMVALWIWAGTAVLGETALGVRVLAPLAAAGGSVLLADAGRRLFGPGAGVRAAVLLNATLMMGVGAATMTPDTPLLLFWTVAAWGLARVATGGGGWWWLVVGGAGGLGLESKYTAGVLGVGLAAWLLLPGGRGWLRTGWPWAGLVVAGVLVAPVAWWNATHGWAGVLRQGGRLGAWSPGRAWVFLLELAGGQMGLATPWVGGLFGWGAWRALRRSWEVGRAVGWGVCAVLVWPGVVLFVEHALGDRVQGNWVAVVYPGCALAASGLWGVRWRGAAWLGVGVTAAVYVQATLAPLVLPRGLDPSLQLAGWGALGRDAVALEGGASGGGAAGFLASEEYGVASLLAWSRPGVPVLGAEARWGLFALPGAEGAGAGVLVLRARRREGPDPAIWAEAVPLGRLVRRRGGVEAEVFEAYRVVLRAGAGAGAGAGVGAVRLPVPGGGLGGAPRG